MNSKAPEGYIWECRCCRKRSQWKYGFDDEGNRVADWEWDESCMLNSELLAASDSPAPEPACRLDETSDC